MTIQKSRTVRVIHRFDASAERVFDAWLDPVTARRWLFATAGGQMVRVEIDARIGGRFVFVDRRNGEDIEHVGKYLEILRPTCLVFAFSVPKYSVVETQVAVDIAARANGCELTLVHDGVLSEFESRTQSGWQTLLDVLATNLASRMR